MQDLADAPSPELLQSLQQSAALTPEQARRTVDTLLRFLAPRLASPLFGQVRAVLAGTNNATGPADRGHR